MSTEKMAAKKLLMCLFMIIYLFYNQQKEILHRQRVRMFHERQKKQKGILLIEAYGSSQEVGNGGVQLFPVHFQNVTLLIEAYGSSKEVGNGGVQLFPVHLMIMIGKRTLG